MLLHADLWVDKMHRPPPFKTRLTALLAAVFLLAACAPPEPITNLAAPQKNTTVLLAANDPHITWTGRRAIDANETVTFGYPGVSLQLVTTASELTLHAHSSGEQSYLDIAVEGRPLQVVNVPTDNQGITVKVSPEGHARLIHIMHRGETWHGVVSVTGLTLHDGELLPAPELPTRKLLVLGDSITCGEAIERQTDCQKDSRWWNARLSYGLLTGNALNAQVHLVCYGGRGLVRSWNGRRDEQNLPDYVELAIASSEKPQPWDHYQYQPDVIVSAIGTNDFSEGIPEATHYIERYHDLITRLHSLHPNAAIAITAGAMLSGEKKAVLQDYLQQIAQRSKVAVTVIPASHYPGDACDAHPTQAQHAAMADDLVAALSAMMNW